MSGLLRLMEAYEWSRAGPEWGKIYRGVAHTDRGKVSAIIQYLLSRGRMRPHGVWHPWQVFRTMRKQVEGVLLKEPISQGYLQRYHRLAAKEWVRLAKVAQRIELERLEGLRREHEAREAARARGEAVVSDEGARG